ncbi:major facilitator superfamily domain-containing protein [Chytridium lagenaria]|nr:major facilitator superfamily domain-containing protein [Chytridium lagenaria]
MPPAVDSLSKKRKPAPFATSGTYSKHSPALNDPSLHRPSPSPNSPTSRHLPAATPRSSSPAHHKALDDAVSDDDDDTSTVAPSLDADWAQGSSVQADGFLAIPVAGGSPREGVEVDDDVDVSLSDGGEDDGAGEDGRTGKEAVLAVSDCIERIGMGAYQWKLFILCGFGWLADNMWLQGISVAIPGLQRDFDVPDAWMGLGTSSAFIGMMLGAAFWGPVSDTIGRKPAFTMTLLITVAFGGLASGASTFGWYCVMLVGMGIGVGGNLPVDGALFLEFVPPSHQNLLTLLSLFWPAGQLVASTAAWWLIPTASCPPMPSPCPDPLINNRGWRRLLLFLSILTFIMLILRVVCFRMLESPKFLVARGRYREAVEVLRRLAEENGKNEEMSCGRRLLVGVEELEGRRGPMQRFGEAGPSTGLLERCPPTPGDWADWWRSVSGGVEYRRVGGEGTRGGEAEWKQTLNQLFGDELRRTTILVWIIWSLISCGYTMFNGFLAKFLGNASDRTTPQTPDETFRDIFIISIMGIPGSVIGMILIETRLGRRGTMAISAFGTAVSLFLFTLSTSSLNQLLSSCLAAVLQNVMYGVLYCYTPEVFDSQVRGTATGVASSLSRIFGTMAPLMTGTLLTISPTLPLYVSSALIFLSSVAMVMLPIETRGRQAL